MRLAISTGLAHTGQFPNRVKFPNMPDSEKSFQLQINYGWFLLLAAEATLWGDTTSFSMGCDVFIWLNLTAVTAGTQFSIVLPLKQVTVPPMLFLASLWPCWQSNSNPSLDKVWASICAWEETLRVQRARSCCICVSSHQCSYRYLFFFPLCRQCSQSSSASASL